MKNNVAIIICALLWQACSKQGPAATHPTADQAADQASVSSLLADEARYVAQNDLAGWSSCWDGDAAVASEVSMGRVIRYKGWNEISTNLRSHNPAAPSTVKRDGHKFTIGNDVAIASFDQLEELANGKKRRTTETRTLRKIDGRWKIVEATVLHVGALENEAAPSFRSAMNKIPPGASLGGMSVNYVEAPVGDFTPLFMGLPHNMCPAPHWGYVIEGSIRITYPDGKADVINAGEIFYSPAPHTGFVEKPIKFLDFSPEHEFTLLMNHVASKAKK